MVSLVVVIHIVVCLTLVTVVLLQQGKGADVGAVFGGSSQTMFGSSGAGNFLTKITWSCAIVFFASAIILAFTSTRRVTGSIFEGARVPLKNVAVDAAGAPVMPGPLSIPGQPASSGPKTTGPVTHAPVTTAPAAATHPITPPPPVSNK